MSHRGLQGESSTLRPGGRSCGACCQRRPVRRPGPESNGPAPRAQRLGPIGRSGPDARKPPHEAGVACLVDAHQWQVKDSNLRRLSRRIYSPLPLATRATCRGSPDCLPAHRVTRIAQQHPRLNPPAPPAQQPRRTHPMADSSFDIVSKLDQQEIDNAINQAPARDQPAVRLQEHRSDDRAVRRARRGDLRERRRPGQRGARRVPGEADQAAAVAEGPRGRGAAAVRPGVQDLVELKEGISQERPRRSAS